MSSWKSQRQMSVKRALALVVVVGTACGALYGANRYQVRRNAGKMLELAREAKAQRNPDALQLYETYLNFQPRDVDAIGEYAAILDGDPNPKAKRALLDCYERLLRVAPHRAEERKKLVAMYLANRVYSSAKHHLGPLLDPLAGTPDDPELLNQLATCEFRGGRTAEGIAILRRLVASGKAAPESYRRLSDALRKDGSTADREESEAVMAQLAKDRADDTTARVVRIQHLYQLGKATEARAEIAAAAKDVRDAEKNPEFSLLLADHHLREGKTEAARDLLARAIAANPNEARLRTAHYETLDRLREKAKADEQLKKAVELAASHDPGTIDLIDLMIDRRELDLARREIDRRYKGKEVYRPVHDYLSGQLLLAEGNWPAAHPALTRCLDYFEKHPGQYAKAQVAIARCQTLANNPERALEAYSRAVAANPRLNVAQLGKAETLLRLKRLKDAEPILREYADAMPAARLSLANAKFAEQFARPVARRNWKEVEDSFGRPPFPIGIEILKAKLLAAQGRADEGELHLKGLAQRATDSTAVPVALAEFVAKRSIPDAIKVLDAAEKTSGDAVPLRIAKATLIARSSADAKAVTALAENAAAFPLDDRHSLKLSIANILIVLRRPEDAAELVLSVAKERPFDLPSRLVLAQNYHQSGRKAELESILEELKALDGENGPHYLFATVMRELTRSPKLDADLAKRLTATLETVIRQREAWPRPHVLLGDIAMRTNDPDAAHKHYRKAFDLGERDESTFRKLLDLALARGRTDEAFRLLDDRDRIAGLPGDLRRTHALLEAASGAGGERGREIVKQTEKSDDPRVQLFRGQWLLLNGRRAEARTAFASAAAHGPHLPEAWTALVQVEAAGDLAGAKATVAKVGPALAAAGDKVSPPTRIPLTVGRCQELVGDIGAAELAYLVGLQTNPNDGPLLMALADLNRRAGRHPDADARCRTILDGSADDDAKRWARRGLALGRVAMPYAPTRIDEAIAILEPNLKPVEHAEDVRLKAFLLAGDPFRRLDAHAMLERSASLDPLSPDEAAQRATLYIQEGRLQAAESDLREATKRPTCRPAHLIALHRVQLRAGRFDAARSTLERIVAALPGSWDATAEQARSFAARGDKARAAATVKAFPNADKPDFLLLATGPLLSEIGCKAEAEDAFRTAAARSQLPQRHAGLVFFLIETDRSIDAIRTAWALPPAECPPPMTKATLLKNAIATRHRPAIPPADREAWDKLVGEAAAWIDGEVKSRPNDPSLLLAQAAILDARERYDEAIAAYEAVLKLDANQMVALNNLASLLSLHKADRSERPLALVNRAIATAGPRGHLLDTRASIHISNGKSQAALVDLSAARLLEPRAVYDFHAALASDDLHETDKKRVYLDSAKTKGLKKTMLHPKEWPNYERLFGPE